MRASVPVELISSASAQEGGAADSYAQEEEDLKKMEAELLKALDGSGSEGEAVSPASDKGKMHQAASETKVIAEKAAAPVADAKDTQTTSAKIIVPTKTGIQPIPHVPANQPDGVGPATEDSSSEAEQKPLQELKQQLALGAPSKKQAPSAKASGVPANKKPQVELAASQGASGDIAQKLAIAESQVKILSKELDLSRRSLSSAEERIDELASIVKSSQPNVGSVTASVTSNSDSGASRGSLAAQAVTGEEEDFAVDRRQASGAPPSRRVAVAPQAANPIDYDSYDPSLRDSSIATITIDKAPLRVGPGKNESALYVLPRATQVTIEYRSGEWYRVVTEAGVRGWVYGSSLRFSTGVSPVSAVRIGGVRALYEPVTFR